MLAKSCLLIGLVLGCLFVGTVWGLLVPRPYSTILSVISGGLIGHVAARLWLRLED